MAKPKVNTEVEAASNEKEYRFDLLPEEIQFICRRCQIAANKRSIEKLECESVTVEGRLCSDVERIRSTLASQAHELNIYRKYASAFIGEKFGDRTVFQKNEIVKWYESKIDEGKRSVDEFLDLLRSIGAEIVGA